MNGSDKLLAVFLDNGVTFEEVAQNVEFVSHSHSINSKLISFDYEKDLLFGVSAEDVRCFPLSEKSRFYKELLADSEFARQSPFLRLSLAKEIGISQLVRSEFLKCAISLYNKQAEFAIAWYELERNRFLQQFRDSLPSKRLPKTIEEFITSNKKQVYEYPKKPDSAIPDAYYDSLPQYTTAPFSELASFFKRPDSEIIDWPSERSNLVFATVWRLSRLSASASLHGSGIFHFTEEDIASLLVEKFLREPPEILWSIRSEVDFRRFVSSATKNLIIDEHRRNKRRKTERLTRKASRNCVDRKPGPLDELMIREQEENFRIFLGFITDPTAYHGKSAAFAALSANNPELNESEIKILDLLFFENLSAKEVAKLLDKPLIEVRSIRRWALIKLRFMERRFRKTTTKIESAD